MLFVTIVHQRWEQLHVRKNPFPRLEPARVWSAGVDVRVPAVLSWLHLIPDLGASRPLNSILTIDLMLFRLYFHGVRKRTGAPFCFGSGLP